MRPNHPPILQPHRARTRRAWRSAARHATALLVTVAAPASAQSHVVRLSLGDAARLAAQQGALAQAARHRAEQAAARLKEQRAALLPSVSADVVQQGRSFNTATLGISLPAAPGQPPLFDPNGQVIGGVNTLDVRGHVSQTLLDVGALARIRGAGAAARASNAVAKATAEQAAAAAAGAYLAVQNATAQLSARIADSVLADSLIFIASAQAQSGVGVALDVTRAESQRASIHAQLITARTARDRARLELLRAVGLPLDTDVQLADSLTVPTDSDTLPNEQGAVARALGARSDLRAADERLAAARQELTAIRAERLPTLSVFADQGYIGKGADHLLPTYTWGLQLSLPLFDGFRRSGRTDEQTAAAAEIEVYRRDLERQAAVEVRASLLDLASAREQIGAARERLQLAHQELAQARDRFRAGVAGNADVITASLSLNGARTQLVDALTAYQTARVSLATAQGAVATLP